MKFEIGDRVKIDGSKDEYVGESYPWWPNLDECVGTIFDKIGFDKEKEYLFSVRFDVPFMVGRPPEGECSSGFISAETEKTEVTEWTFLSHHMIKL